MCSFQQSDTMKKYPRVSHSDMNKLVMDYLVMEGYKEAAIKFNEESGTETSISLDSLNERIQIRNSILSGKVQEATNLLNRLHPELLDDDRFMKFRLQQLHVIELIRTGKIEQALFYAQSELSEAGENNPNMLGELERTLALLAFENPAASPFGDLLDFMQRRNVASELNAAILIREQPNYAGSGLSCLLKLILWAQTELEKKGVQYPTITELNAATGEIEL